MPPKMQCRLRLDLTWFANRVAASIFAFHIYEGFFGSRLVFLDLFPSNSLVHCLGHEEEHEATAGQAQLLDSGLGSLGLYH